MSNNTNPLYKVSKESWIKKGLLTVRRYGIFNLNILDTATKLGVTKGSFYHHFSNFNDFQIAIAEHWKHLLLKDIDKLDASNVPDAIAKFYSAINISEETNFRTWAAYNPEIKKELTALDIARIEFLKKLYLSKNSQDDSFTKAYLEYGAFIGLQQLFEYLNPQEIKSVSKEFMLRFRH